MSISSLLLEHSSINEMMIEQRNKTARRKATKIGIAVAVTLAMIAGVLYVLFK